MVKKRLAVLFLLLAAATFSASAAGRIPRRLNRGLDSLVYTFYAPLADKPVKPA